MQLRFALRYLRHLSTSLTAHGIHSPFVYQLVNDVIYDRRNYYAFTPIEILRSQLMDSKEQVDVIDFGAGSVIQPSLIGKQKVHTLVKNSAKSPKLGKLLFRLVNYFQPQNMLELGTSLGISALYQGAANHTADFITLEGNPHIAAIAEKNIAKLKLSHIKIIVGDFKDTLPLALKQLSRVDYVFFDGNHRKEATLQYFDQCLQYSHEDSIFIFDDIHWSDGMQEAWEAIKQHPQVKATVDVFFLGIVFFKKGLSKQDFKIRF